MDNVKLLFLFNALVDLSLIFAVAWAIESLAPAQRARRASRSWREGDRPWKEKTSGIPQKGMMNNGQVSVQGNL